MKQLTMIFTAIMLFTFAVFAQEVAPVPSADVIKGLIDLIGGWKGLTTFAAALAVLQLVVMFLNSELSGGLLAKVSTEVKFFIIQGLSIGVAYLTLVVSGVSGVEALVKTLAMPLVSEYLFKLYKHLIEKKAQA